MFEIFNMKPKFDVDARSLETAYYELSRSFHPDRVSRGAGKDEIIRRQTLSAELNTAYRTLLDPEARLDALLEIAGSKTTSEKTEAQAQIPMELAEEYFELQEAQMEGATGITKKAAAFAGKVALLSKDIVDQIYKQATAIDWSNPDMAAVGKILELRRKRSYLDSLVENAKRLGVMH